MRRSGPFGFAGRFCVVSRHEMGGFFFFLRRNER